MSNAVKLIGALTALLVALTGLWLAVSGGGDAPVPAVIIIRGSVLDDDGMTDSERDREWLLQQRTTTTDALIDDR